MTMFRLRAYDLISYGPTGYSISLGIAGPVAFPERRVEAKNVKELVPLMDAYEADAKASGKPLKLYCMLVSNRDRKPAGFNAATDDDGALSRYVNTDACPESRDGGPRRAPVARTLSA